MRTVLVSSLLLVLPYVAFAATIHVPADAPTIQAGIDAVAEGDTVLVACGTYYEHDIVMRSGVHLRSETGAPECVTVDAQQQGRVLFCDNVNETASIVGFTMRNGAVADDQPGGAVYLIDSSPVISHCSVTGSYAGAGGGIYCYSSSPSISHCLIAENRGGGGGGGMQCRWGSNPVITDCVFAANSGMDAGGIWIRFDSSPILSRCLFVGNIADFWGGAVCCDRANPILRNCTLVDNEAGWSGGGIWCSYSALAELENTIIAFSRDGEGIHCYIDPYHPSKAVLTCCNVYGNADGEYGGSLEDQTGTNGNISEDPLFCDFEAGDFALSSDSPCLPENNDCGSLIGAFGMGCYAPASVSAEVASSGFRSLTEPNPFGPGTSIRFHLETATVVGLGIYDLSGRQVRSLIGGERYPTGTHRAMWDGRDDLGRRLAPGVYFYRLATGDGAETGKMTLLE